ncbi:damage-inducible protein DinB [Exilibacterium tricleocarpae]|uniref:Damage-inducible protein DinB n=2 Tax=Exilibacterium tricleocarpae TaxID=2591008 RepID=A0A545TFR2_9GAMM|nr:damage-inducible protein DinB [Exilibacterium tricleocarpae]
MNKKLYEAASTLDDTALREDLGAFFGSIMGTLNHILVADILWLQRFIQHPADYRSLDYVSGLDKPASLRQLLYPTVGELAAVRTKMDEAIIRLCEEAREEDFEYSFSYQNTRGEAFTKRFGFLVQHVFNHQTHHRGQATTLLYQKGIDIGVTDLPAITPAA